MVWRSLLQRNVSWSRGLSMIRYSSTAAAPGDQASPRAKLIDGNKISKQIKDEVRDEVARLVANGERRPHLSVILVGEDPASHTYVKNKVKACEYTGIESTKFQFDATMSEADLLAKIHELNNDDKVDGLLVQLPVPKHINERAVCNAIRPSKDVDGFHIINVGRFCTDLDALLPATPWGVMELIRRTGIETFGKNAVVVGRSKNVGMPISMLLHSDGVGETDAGDATTVICHRYTPPDQLRIFTKLADIIVVACGIPKLITADMIKPGCAIIDVGINRVKDEQTGKYKLVGDADFEGCSKVASWITPVPGGVGPMTVAMLMKNCLKARKRTINYER